MNTFLESVLDALPEWDVSPNTFHFILPSKRAGTFLKQRMAEKVNGSCIVPNIDSIESFVESISESTQASSLQLLFRLYEVYLEEPLPDKDSFHDFASWGQMLLQDFNEIDRYLVEAEALFETLSDLNELNQWNVGGAPTAMMERQLAFWRSLEPIYHKFRDRLKAERLGYQGLLYSSAVERMEKYLKNHPDIRFIFAGFNALNTAEQRIIQFFLDSGRAEIFWDADSFYLDNPLHDAGLFLRKHQKEWRVLNGTLKGVQNNLTQPKNISIIGLPKSISQAKYCGEMLSTLLDDSQESLQNTAVVLGDETLLDPILHSLPEKIKQVNVTMGYPIAGSPFAQLFESLFDLLLERKNNGWRTQSILRVLAHPFLQAWFENQEFHPAETRSILIRKNSAYTNSTDLSDAKAPVEIIQGLLPAPTTRTPSDLIRHFLNLILILREAYRDTKQSIGLEYLHHFYALFNQLGQLCEKHPFVGDLRSLRTLYKQLLNEERIDFRGEPLAGLQIMGMLESRNLDFKTVVLTSVNEGILPSGKTNASFIPFDVKRRFGLPTYKEKDAVYTYHFYRLLQRASNIVICYNTEPDVLEGGEPSRFIHQLRTDPVFGPQIKHQIAAPGADSRRSDPLEIRKSDSLLKRLREMAEKGFSPTALSNLITDPMSFYRKNVLGIHESDVLEETLAANTFGTVLHQALEDLYVPVLGEVLDANTVKEMMGKAPAALMKAFRQHYLEKGLIQGKNLIAFEVMKQYLSHFLQAELKDCSRHEIIILGVEEKIRLPIRIPGISFPVYLKGTVDRIEQVDGELRIVDYKTGRVNPSDLRISSWDRLIQDEKRTKALQVLTYAWLYASKSKSSSLKAGILSFKNLASGRQWFGYKPGSGKTEELIDTATLGVYEDQIASLLTTLFDREVPLAQAHEPA